MSLRSSTAGRSEAKALTGRKDAEALRRQEEGVGEANKYGRLSVLRSVSRMSIMRCSCLH